MRIRNEQDFWSGVMFVGIGLGFAFIAQGYGMGTIRAMGPGWFPAAAGLVMAGLGAVLCVRSVLRGEVARIGRIGWRELLTVLVGLALFAGLLPHLGLVVSIALLVFASSAAGWEFRPVEAAVITLVLVVAAYLVFAVGLAVQVPVWPRLQGG